MNKYFKVHNDAGSVHFVIDEDYGDRETIMNACFRSFHALTTHMLTQHKIYDGKSCIVYTPSSILEDVKIEEITQSILTYLQSEEA